MKKIIFFFIRIIRIVLNFPFIIIIKFGNVYFKILRLLDPRNHDNFWPEEIDRNLNNFKSKKILISKKNNISIQFYSPSKIAGYRIKTFFSKEPETLKWLDKNGGKNKVLFDIGANMGVYSIYFAKKFDAQVFSFEPSFKNLEVLSKNVKLNFLHNNVKIISNPLCNDFTFSKFYQNDFLPGEAKARFIIDKNDLEEYSKNFNQKSNEVFYNTLGFSLDNLLDKKIIDKPDLIKIDVDGNELEIIKGAKNLLNNTNKLSILLEIRKDTKNQISEELTKTGFHKILSVRDNEIWEK